MYIWLFRFKFLGNIWAKYSHLPLCLCISILLALTQVHCGVISDKIKISTKAKISQKARFFKMSFLLFLSFVLEGATGFHGQLICKGPRKMNIFYDVPQSIDLQSKSSSICRQSHRSSSIPNRVSAPMHSQSHLYGTCLS